MASSEIDSYIVYSISMIIPKSLCNHDPIHITPTKQSSALNRPASGHHPLFTTPLRTIISIIINPFHVFDHGQRQRPRSEPGRPTTEARKAESPQERFDLDLTLALFHLSTLSNRIN